METETITLYASDFNTKKDYYNTKQEFLMLGFTVKESSKHHFTLCKDHPVKNTIIESINNVDDDNIINKNVKECLISEKNKHASILRRSDTPQYLKFKK